MADKLTRCVPPPKVTTDLSGIILNHTDSLLSMQYRHHQYGQGADIPFLLYPTATPLQSKDHS